MSSDEKARKNNSPEKLKMLLDAAKKAGINLPLDLILERERKREEIRRQEEAQSVVSQCNEKTKTAQTKKIEINRKSAVGDSKQSEIDLFESLGSANDFDECVPDVTSESEADKNAPVQHFAPEFLSAETVVAVYHIEAGMRKFADFSAVMIEEIGEEIKPYLKWMYESARRFPGMEQIAKDMDTAEIVDNFDLDSLITKRINDANPHKMNDTIESEADKNAPVQHFDPEMMNDILTVTCSVLESGAKDFESYAKKMLSLFDDKLKEQVKTWLKPSYNYARSIPGIEHITRDMDSAETVVKFDLDGLTFDEDDDTAKEEPKLKINSKINNAMVEISNVILDSKSKSFSDYVKAFYYVFGEEGKNILAPYMKGYYNLMRSYPGVDSTGMDSYDFVDKFDIDSLTFDEDDDTANEEPDPQEKPKRKMMSIARKILQSRYAMACLVWMTGYEQELLEQKILDGTILLHLQNKAQMAEYSLAKNEDNPNLPFGGAEEIAMAIATGQSEKPYRLLKGEKLKLFKEWWQITFPGEPMSGKHFYI